MQQLDHIWFNSVIWLKLKCTWKDLCSWFILSNQSLVYVLLYFPAESGKSKVFGSTNITSDNLRGVTHLWFSSYSKTPVLFMQTLSDHFHFKLWTEIPWRARPRFLFVLRHQVGLRVATWWSPMDAVKSSKEANNVLVRIKWSNSKMESALWINAPKIILNYHPR